MYSSTPCSFATKVVFPEPTSPEQKQKQLQTELWVGDLNMTASTAVIMIILQADILCSCLLLPSVILLKVIVTHCRVFFLKN